MFRLVVDTSALLFLFLTITLSVVDAQPQQLACPDGKIYGYVNETGTGRDVYVEVPAKDLQECIHRCYGNEFCYSLRYDGGRTSAPCDLYYYSAYNCTFLDLVLATDISYSGGAITIDCLRCPALGDFRAGGAGDFSVDEKGEHVGKPVGVGNFSEVPVIEVTTPSGVNASEATNETVVTTPVEGTNISSDVGASSAAPSINETTEGVVGNETLATNETVGAEGSIDATPQSFTKSPSGPRQPCDGEIKFRPLEHFQSGNSRPPVFQNHTTTETSADCARMCYELGCHLAQFMPAPQDSGDVHHTCQFAFESEENVGLTEKTGCDQEVIKSESEHSLTTPVVLACIQCASAGENTTTTPASNETVTGEPEGTNGSAGSGAKNTCDGDVYFLESEQIDATSKQFANVVSNATTAADCAQQCYAAGCEVAHYDPESSACLLTPPGATGIVRDCVLVHPSAFVKEYDAKQAVDISCPHCGQPVDLSTATEQPSGNATVESSIDNPPETGEGPHESCTVTFQVDAERKTDDIEFRDIARVESIDQCAYICYRDSCSLAVFDPPTTPEGKGYCKTQFKDGPVCNETLPRVYQYPTEKSVAIQCLHCSLEGVTGEPTGEGSTGWRAVTENSTSVPGESGVNETTPIGSNETVSSQPLTVTEAPSGPANETSGNATNLCKITFQAVDSFAHPIDETQHSENATAGLSAAECAKECFQKKCLRAAHDPQSSLCLLSFPTEAETCVDIERVTVLESDKQTWLQCIKCEPIEEKDVASVPSGTQIITLSAHDVGAESVDQGAVTEPSNVNVTVGPETNETVTVVALPAEEGNATTVETEHAGNETVTVQPAEEGNATTVGTENTGNETVIVQPAEEGNATTVETEHAGNETVIVQPAEEGNTTTVVTNNAGNETVVVQPAEEGNVTTIETEHAGNETIIQPAAEGNTTTVVTENAGNETVIVQPAEEGNATTVETEHGGNETVVVQPAEEGNATTVETEHAGNETVIVQPAEEGNVTTVGPENAGNETVVVQPVEEGNATTVGTENTGNETVIVQPAEEGNVTTVGPEHAGNETVIVQPAEEGNATEVTVNGGNATVVVQPSEEGNGSVVTINAGNETVVVHPSEEGNGTTVVNLEGAAGGNGTVAEQPAGGNETVIVPAIEGEPTVVPGGDNETVTEAPTQEGNVTLSAAELNATTEATEPAFVTEKDNANETTTTAIALINGCVVTFEFDAIDKKPAEAADGFNSETKAETAAICARRCYQDGCTGASYDPSSTDCVLTYGDYDSCTNTGTPIFVLKATEAVWIRCARCQTNLPQIEEGAEIVGQLDQPAGEGATATEPTSSASEVTGEGVTVGEAFAGEANATTVAAPGSEGENATVETSTTGEVITNETLPSNETVPIVIAPSEDNATVAGGETVEFSTSAPSENETSITIAPQSEGEAVTVESGGENVTEATNGTAIGGAIDVTPSNVEKEETVAPEHVGEEGAAANATESSADLSTPHGCSVTFEVEEPSAAFAFVNSSDERNASDCARRCFLTGCTVAGWEPGLNVCSFYFGDPVPCANSRRYFNFVATRPVWLQCLKCVRWFVAGTGPQIQRPKPNTPLISASVATPTLAGHSAIVTAGLEESSNATSEAPGLTETSTGGETQSGEGETTATSESPSGAEETTAAAEGSTSNETAEGAVPMTTALADGQVTEAPAGDVSASPAADNVTPQPTSEDEPTTQAGEVTGAPSEDQSSGPTGEPSLETTQTAVVESTDESAASRDNAQAAHASPSTDKSTGCGGRLQFQVVAVNNMPHLNVTNDISATSPAECAKKCFDALGCKMAGFIPSPSGQAEGGVCLLTTDPEICLNDVPFTPQHASLTPFVVSCMQCTPCNYQLSSATPDRVLPDFEEKEAATSVTECAHHCSSKKCTMARFSAADRTCEMTVSTFIGYDQCDAKTEQPLTTDGPLPTLLQCVNCS